MRRLRVPLVVLVVAGCSSMAGPEYQPVRLYERRDLALVVAAVLDAFPDARAKLVDARLAAEGNGAIVKGVASVGRPQPLTFLLEVSVVQKGDDVRVSVSAEPADGGPPPLAGQGRPRDDASRQGCSTCPAADPLLPVESRPRDNLLVLSESRKLVRAYLAALDGRVR